MKHVFACMAVLCLNFAQPTYAGDQKMNPTETKVHAAIETMTTAFERGDLDTVMSSYEPGAAVLFNPGEPVTDPQQLRQMFAGMAALKPHFDYSDHEVVVVGDIAVHIAPWHMAAKDPNGNAVEQSGLSVAVLRKQEDGSWKMVIDNPNGSHLMSAAQ